MASQTVGALDAKIRQYLARRNGPALQRLMERHNFADLAEVMENTLTPEELVTCFQFLNVGQAANVLTSLSPERQALCLSGMPIAMSSQILRHMPSDDAVDILQELDSQQIKKILDDMPFDMDTRRIHHLMQAAPDTAEGIMSTDFLQVNIEGNVHDAIEQIKQAEEKDFSYYCYVVDDRNSLLGVVSLKQLIREPADTPLKEVTHFDIRYVKLSDDQESVVNLFRKYYNLLAVPVVDDDHVLQGIVSLDDVVYIIDEESSEDIYLSSGINVEDMDEKNLLTGPTMKAVKARMPWLLVTLVGQFFAAMIIASFHNTVSSAVIAVSFMPLLSGLSGNMGTQSETITVRGLALNLINDENIWQKFRRELKVGLVTGSCFSIGVALLSYLQYRHAGLSAMLFVAIILSVCMSATLGMLIPYCYRRFCKQDPAGVGGPMITTLLDILTFSAYLYAVSVFIERMI